MRIENYKNGFLEEIYRSMMMMFETAKAENVYYSINCKHYIWLQLWGYKLPKQLKRQKLMNTVKLSVVF